MRNFLFYILLVFFIFSIKNESFPYNNHYTNWEFLYGYNDVPPLLSNDGLRMYFVESALTNGGKVIISGNVIRVIDTKTGENVDNYFIPKEISGMSTNIQLVPIKDKSKLLIKVFGENGSVFFVLFNEELGMVEKLINSVEITGEYHCIPYNHSSYNYLLFNSKNKSDSTFAFKMFNIDKNECEKFVIDFSLFSNYVFGTMNYESRSLFLNKSSFLIPLEDTNSVSLFTVNLENKTTKLFKFPNLPFFNNIDLEKFKGFQFLDSNNILLRFKYTNENKQSLYAVFNIKSQKFVKEFLVDSLIRIRGFNFVNSQSNGNFILLSYLGTIPKKYIEKVVVYDSEFKELDSLSHNSTFMNSSIYSQTSNSIFLFSANSFIKYDLEKKKWENLNTTFTKSFSIVPYKGNDLLLFNREHATDRDFISYYSFDSLIHRPFITDYSFFPNKFTNFFDTESIFSYYEIYNVNNFNKCIFPIRLSKSSSYNIGILNKNNNDISKISMISSNNKSFITSLMYKNSNIIVASLDSTIKVINEDSGLLDSFKINAPVLFASLLDNNEIFFAKILKSYEKNGFINSIIKLYKYNISLKNEVDLDLTYDIRIQHTYLSSKIFQFSNDFSFFAFYDNLSASTKVFDINQLKLINMSIPEHIALHYSFSNTNKQLFISSNFANCIVYDFEKKYYHYITLTNYHWLNIEKDIRLFDSILTPIPAVVFSQTYSNDSKVALITSDGSLHLVENPLSVDGSYIDVQSIDDFIIYPNPSNEFLNFKFIDGEIVVMKVNIIDALGFEIKTNYSSEVNTNSIRTSDLPSGVYVLKVYTNKQIFFQKFIKI